MKANVVYLCIYLISLTICSGQVVQRVITYDSKGRLITTYSGQNIPGIYAKTYLGSPYLGDLIWHPGTLIYRNQHEVAAQIAYDLILNQLFWRLNDSSAVSQILPDEFIIEGQHFISEQHKPLGINMVSYSEILYDGQTKLLRRWTKHLRLIDPKTYTHRIPLDDRFAGEYILSKDLYIQKEGERPKFIIPTEYSLSRVLPNMGPDLANFIAAHELTDQVLVEVLIQYDKRHYSLKQAQ